MVDAQLIPLLRCPETGQKFVLAADPVIGHLNRIAAGGRLANRAGQLVQEKLDGGLIRDDQRFLYPIRNSIPVLIIDEAIPMPTI